jgi:hypothetical protein
MRDERLRFIAENGSPNLLEDARKLYDRKWDSQDPTTLPSGDIANFYAGGYAKILHIELDSAYTGLLAKTKNVRRVPDFCQSALILTCSTQQESGFANAFVLKTYSDTNSVTYYYSEVEAFRKRRSLGDIGRIRYCSSRIRGESYNMLLEYDELACQERYMEWQYKVDRGRKRIPFGQEALRAIYKPEILHGYVCKIWVQ